MKFIVSSILSLFLIGNVYADKISAPPPLSKEYEDISEVLYHYLREVFDNYHVLEVTTTAPNGNRKSKIGSMIVYNNSGTFEFWINDDGSTSWSNIDTDTDTVGANKALSNLVSIAINTSLISDTNNTDDLGSDAKEWKDIWIDGTAYLDAAIMHGDLNFNDNQAINFIVENRTNDTGMTVTGQLWFRTDI